MSVNDLVQVGSDLYLLKSDVVKIYKTEPMRIEGVLDSPGHVYVVSRTFDIFGTSDVYRTSDWPIERVRAALGLTDATELFEMWEQS